MKLLLADDDPLFCRLAEGLLAADYEVQLAHDGEQAWRMLVEDATAKIAAINWVMPGLDGLQLCRRIRETPALARIYVLLITARGSVEDVVRGLEAGADDYIIKPFHAAEFRARVRVGERMVRLQDALSDRIGDLEQALEHVQILQGLLPICAYCKRIRDDTNYWEQLENYLSERSHLEFTHSICPDCYEKHWKPELERMTNTGK